MKKRFIIDVEYEPAQEDRLTEGAMIMNLTPFFYELQESKLINKIQRASIKTQVITEEAL